jgi:hypothetical protein
MGHKLKLDDLTSLLDQAARQLPNDTLDHLQAARRQALDRQRQAMPAALLSRLCHLVTDHGHLAHPQRTLGWVAGLLLAIAVLAGGWQWERSAWHDHAEIDLAILTDDLPLHMYVD